MLNIRILPLLALLLFGCRKNELTDKVTIDEDPPVVLVVSSFKGKVLDENGQPVPGARVSVFKESTVTDQNGLFEFKNIEAPKDPVDACEGRFAGYYSKKEALNN